MAIDIHARPPNIVLTPLIILRWITAMAQLLVVMGSEALFSIPLPVKPLLCLVAASFILNIQTQSFAQRRPVQEETARLHLTFDILQFCGFLFFTGGIGNPFAILLLAPLAMAASLLSLYSLCLLIILTVLCVSVLSFGAFPLQWPDPQPFLAPSYQHGVWIALMVTLVFVSFIIWRLAMEGRKVNEALVHTSAILEEKRRITALGALAAAAVHELGSPLGTIAVVTTEMQREMHPDDPLAEDIMILREQADKCKRILADIARNPDRKMAELASPIRLDRMLIELVAELNPDHRGVLVDVHSRVPENLPFITKTPDLDYGLGNLIGNAISYARHKVLVTVEGNADVIDIQIQDDGPGFTPVTLATVGQPYISTRESRQHHMGLGIFISINLLEATGAKLRFMNAPRGGALIGVSWPRSVLEPGSSDR